MSSPTTTNATASTPPVLDDERTCHALPCNIEFQGMAPTHLYFRPVQEEEHEVESENNKNGRLVSSTFRGRGLLAINKNYETPVQAALLSIQNNDQVVQTKAEIHNFLEWQHEHHPETMRFEAGGGRVGQAQEWLQVANALHEPIPVDGNTLVHP